MFTFLALLEMQNLYKQYPDFMRLISQMGIPTIFFLWSNFLFHISINIRSVKINIWNAHYCDACNQSGGPLSRTWLDESSVRKSCEVDDSPSVKTSLLFTVPHPEITLTRHRGRGIPGTSVRSARQLMITVTRETSTKYSYLNKVVYLNCITFLKIFMKTYNQLIY